MDTFKNIIFQVYSVNHMISALKVAYKGMWKYNVSEYQRLKDASNNYVAVFGTVAVSPFLVMGIPAVPFIYGIQCIDQGKKLEADEFGDFLTNKQTEECIG